MLGFGVEFVAQHLDQSLVLLEGPVALCAAGVAEHQAPMRVLAKVVDTHQPLQHDDGRRRVALPDPQVRQQREALEVPAAQAIVDFDRPVSDRLLGGEVAAVERQRILEPRRIPPIPSSRGSPKARATSTPSWQ